MISITEMDESLERISSFIGKNVFSDVNKVYISGIVAEKPYLYYTTEKSRFYRTEVHVQRNSGTVDCISIVFHEEKLKQFKVEKGMAIEVAGQFRSHLLKNSYYNCKKTDLFVFAQFLCPIKNISRLNKNFIYLEGAVSKRPNFRITPNGIRITDVSIAVNRIGDKKDFVPLIVWEDLAYMSSELNIGDKIKIFGRIQSRYYQKNLSDDEIAMIEVIEISVFEFC